MRGKETSGFDEHENSASTLKKSKKRTKDDVESEDTAKSIDFGTTKGQPKTKREDVSPTWRDDSPNRNHDSPTKNA